MTVVPVVLGGGVGSRLWPLSRDMFPKPFMTLPDGRTLMRDTYERLAALTGVERIVTVTNRDLLFLTIDEFERAGSHAGLHSFIVEPFGRDTAAAVALASLQVAEAAGPGTIMLITPADHLIRGQDAFERAVNEATSLAETGRIVVFGVAPTRPETGFGYIEAQNDRVVRFVEKPDAQTASDYLATGRHFWNTGMVCCRAGDMVDSLRHLSPNTLAQAEAALSAASVHHLPGQEMVYIEKGAFAQVEPISLDYAVLEKSNDLSFVPCGFDWSDVGSWTAVSDLTVPDVDGNRTHGAVVTHGTRNTFVHGENRVVALVGVSDLLVIDTADALMIADRRAAQDVKLIYEKLKNTRSDTAVFHRTTQRPWGRYTVLEEGERFKIKRLEVRPGASLSLQAHHHRSEHWVVVRGTAKVINGDEEMLLAPNQSTYIPCGRKHRLENPGKLGLIMIEVQTGEYLGEDDIVRYPWSDASANPRDMLDHPLSGGGNAGSAGTGVRDRQAPDRIHRVDAGGSW